MVWEKVVDFLVIVRFFLKIANQIATMHMSRKCHMIYAQLHLTSTHGYITEPDKIRQFVECC